MHYSEKVPLPPIEQKFDCCLVIPCCNEQYYLPQCFSSLTQAAHIDANALVVFVINARKNAPQNVLDSNQSCMEYLRKQGSLISENENISFLKGDGFHFLICDFNSELRLPNDQGVGLARKIGSDIALQLIANNHVLSPWITHTDADAIVPNDYFENAPFKNTMPDDAVVGIFNFIHAPVSAESSEGYDPKFLNTAIRDYHRYLQYYVDGLAFANSPYAHHTVGSTMSFHYDAYAKVRGYPKREAGEDFYLLNKLSKLGKVRQFETTPITLQGRPSDRVPFGTGQANRKLYDLYTNNLTFDIYHPRCFTYLKCYLAATNQLLDDLCFDTFYQNLGIQSEGESAFVKGVTLHYEKGIHIAFKQGKNTSDRKIHFNTWFDSFKTLKFIHWIRDDFCGTLPIEEAFKERKGLF